MTGPLEPAVRMVAPATTVGVAFPVNRPPAPVARVVSLMTGPPALMA